MIYKFEQDEQFFQECCYLDNNIPSIQFQRMSRKTEKWINWGFSIYYAIGLLVTAIFGVIYTFIWLYKVIVGEVAYSGSILAAMIILTLVLGLMGLALFKVGQEELED